MTVATMARPRGRRRYRTDGMSREEELQALIAEQQADDTQFIDRPDHVISLDALAPKQDATIGDLIGYHEVYFKGDPESEHATGDGGLIAFLSLPASPPLGNAKQHGTNYGYMRMKCRCARCKEANAKYMREYRARKRAES